MIKLISLLNLNNVIKIAKWGCLFGLLLFAFLQTMRLDRAKKDLAICSQLRKNEFTTINLETAKVEAKAVAEKTRIETRYVKVKDETDSIVRNRLDLELERLRKTKTLNSSSDAKAARLPNIASPAPDLERAGQTSIMDDDKERCTAATVKAQGWQDFYKGLTNLETLPL